MEHETQPGSYHGAVLFRHETESLLFTEDHYEPHSLIPPHSHPWPMLTVVLNGSFSEELEDRTEECLPGTVLVRPPGSRHSDVISIRPTRLLNIELEPSYMNRTDWPERVEFAPPRSRGLAIEIQQHLTLEQRVSRDVEMLLERLIETLDGFPAGQESDAQGEPEWLSEVDALISDRYLDPLDLSRMASDVGVHPVHLSRTHRRFRGETIVSKIARLRVEFASTLLLDESMALSSIALDSGFSDQSHMNRTFRKIAGVTPGTLRQVGRFPSQVNHVQ